MKFQEIPGGGAGSGERNRRDRRNSFHPHNELVAAVKGVKEFLRSGRLRSPDPAPADPGPSPAMGSPSLKIQDFEETARTGAANR